MVNSPLDFGNVPVGSQQTGKLIITNGGDAPLVIDEIQMDAVNPAFQISLKELPVTITARQALELVIVFTPTSDGPYQTELNFVSNHSGDDLEPVILKGNGEQDTVCRSCEPPPGPECAQNGDLSLTFTANTTTSCESESGECGYTIIETPCEWGPCIEETGLCPEIGDTNDPNEQVICGDGVLSETEECDDGNILVENCPYGEGACEVCGENCTMVTGLIQFCGDNQLQEDEEECDNGMIGNSNEAADACRTNCKLPSCGDGVTDTNEVCDDGNGLNFDGCSSACVVEDGWDCTGPICVPICGDNLVVGNEQCDDGNLETEYCEYAATYCVVCNHECMYGPGLLQSCGDGIMQAGEECDNGDSNNDYAPNACRENCKIAGCGDGVIDLNESCDDDNSENNDGCSDACLIEEGWECIGQPSACETICGDLIIAGNEECDNGLSGNLNCDYDIMSCEVCGEDCTLVDGQLVYCGDGVLQEDYEECDNGTMDAVDDSPGVYNSDSMDDACRTNCKEAHCGDGVIDGNEVCDDLNDLDGDGCSSACVVEDGWECFNEPSECERIGLEPPGEDCYNASQSFQKVERSQSTTGPRMITISPVLIMHRVAHRRS